MDTLTNLATRILERWPSLAWHAAWQGAVVGLLALAVVATGRRWPAPVRYWILVLALIKFVTPPVGSLPTGIFSLVSVSESHVVTADTATANGHAPANHEFPLPSSESTPSPPASGMITDQTAVPTGNFTSQSPSKSIPIASTISSSALRSRAAVWPTVLVLAHLGGSLFVLALFAARAIRLQTSWRRMEEPGRELAATAREIARQLGLRRVPSLRISRDDLVPFSMGVIRPVVVLPARIIEQSSPVEVHAILFHELAHHRRGDLSMNLLQLAISAAWWFHPVVWFLNRAIRSIREECCDDLLLSRKFVSDIDYCTTLVHVADACGRRRPSSLVVAVSMVDGSHPLTARIRRIMDESLPRHERPGAWAVMALLALAAVVLPGVRAAGPTKSDATKASHAAVSGVPGNPQVPRDKAERQEGADRPSVRARPSPIAERVAEPELSPDPRADAPGRAVGGRVVDEQNQPVAGAAVALRVVVEKSTNERGKPSQSWFEAKTADDGTWSIARLPAGTRLASMRVSHPGYVGMLGFTLDSKANSELYESKYERILQKGVPVFGRVTDRDGQPVAEATVALGQYFNNFDSPSTAKTGDDGTFRLEHCPEGNSLLTVIKIGLAPHMQTVVVTKADAELNVTLAPGQTLRLRVTDKAGQPVANADVSPFKWADTVTLTRLHNFGQTDANGIWTWDWAPDEDLTYMIFKDGYVRIKNQVLRPSPQLQEAQLQPELRVRVKVTDDATDRPITAFRATLGLLRESIAPKTADENRAPSDVQWLQPHAAASPDGECIVRHGHFSWGKYVVRIDAESYHSAKSRVYRPDEENVTIDFRLHAARQREALALNADGTPAAGVSVLIGTQANPASIRDHRPDPSGRALAAQVDAEGRFRIEGQADDYTIFVLGTSGFAVVPRGEFDAAPDEPVKIVLKPWARVEGTVRKRQTPLPAERVHLDFAEGRWNSSNSGVHGSYNLQTKSDTSGHFIFDRVPSGINIVVTHYGQVRTHLGPFLGSHNSVKFKLAAGQVRTIALGGTGRTVVGRFRLKDEAWAVDWEASIGVLEPTAEPAEVDIAYCPAPLFDIEPDGSFRIDDVAPGPYRIAFSLLALKPESSLRQGPRAVPQNQKGTQGLMAGEIVVPEAAKGTADQSVDIGTLPVGYANAPAK